MELIQQLDDIQDQVNRNFSSLSGEQLNWKPGPDNWSIGQCLDHLIVSNKTYFPSFEKFLRNEYRLPLFQRLNPFKKALGSMMIKTLGPNAVKKFHTPPIFEPSQSSITPTIFNDFSDHQRILKKYMEQLLQLNTKQLFMTSPVTPMISYSLDDALRILTGHEQRHVNQAINVLHHPNFPK